MDTTIIFNLCLILLVLVLACYCFGRRLLFSDGDDYEYDDDNSRIKVVTRGWVVDRKENLRVI